jgi:hypothetical protein
VRQQALPDNAVAVVPTQGGPRARGRAAPGRYKADTGPQPAADRRRQQGRQDRRRQAPRRRDGSRRASGPLGGRGTGQVVGVAVAATAGVAALDLALTGRLSQFFDLCFVLAGLVPALQVRREGLFAVGVLPPLLLGGVVAVLAALAPGALTTSHLAFVSTWLTGLAHHGAALVATHLVVLAIIGLRAGQQRQP